MKHTSASRLALLALAGISVPVGLMGCSGGNGPKPVKVQVDDGLLRIVPNLTFSQPGTRDGQIDISPLTSFDRNSEGYSGELYNATFSDGRTAQYVQLSGASDVTKAGQQVQTYVYTQIASTPFTEGDPPPSADARPFYKGQVITLGNLNNNFNGNGNGGIGIGQTKTNPTTGVEEQFSYVSNSGTVVVESVGPKSITFRLQNVEFVPSDLDGTNQDPNLRPFTVNGTITSANLMVQNDDTNTRHKSLDRANPFAGKFGPKSGS